MSTKKSQTRFTYTTAIAEQFIATDAPDFDDYVSEAVGTRHWALCRKSKHALARYDACISQSQYKSIQRKYLKDGGDPRHVDQRIAEECGWVLRWVRIAPEAVA